MASSHDAVPPSFPPPVLRGRAAAHFPPPVLRGRAGWGFPRDAHIATTPTPTLPRSTEGGRRRGNRDRHQPAMDDETFQRARLRHRHPALLEQPRDDRLAHAASSDRTRRNALARYRAGSIPRHGAGPP